MAELHKDYDDGFKLTGESLETICSSLIERMKSETIADNFNTAFKLKYIDDLTVDRPDIAAILEEKNGGMQTIKELTIMLTGTKNNIKTASITLTFAARSEKSITYDIWSSNEEWFKHALKPSLESLIDEVKKPSISRSVNQLASQVKVLSSLLSPFLASFYVVENIADDSLRSLGKIFLSSDCVFYWGEAVEVNKERKALIKDIRRKIIEVAVVAIFIGLIVSIVGGLIANYITLYFFHWHG
jgi:hypothetical protein